MEKRNNRASRSLRSCALLAFVFLGSAVADLSAAQSPACLVEAPSQAADPLAYQPRDSRCEGALPRYVASATDVRLVGYRANALRMKIPGDPAISLVALGKPPGREVAVRALSLTSTYRYQMDYAAARIGEVFLWPLDVASRVMRSGSGKGLDPATLGVLACDNRCLDGLDTTYWPVAAAPSASVDVSRLTLLLRSGVRAERVRITVQPLDGRAVPRPVGTSQEVLLPDVVRAIDLPPDLPSGLYRLTVDARDGRLRALGSLRTTIFVPATIRP